MNCINTDYFKPFLQAFCEKTQPLYTCGYPWGPFVPYTMPRYNDADVKIFYMGRDTYYWVEQEELFEAFTNHVLEDYLGKNAACVDVEKMLGWKNNAGSFWTMVAKLHLLIRTGRYTEDIMQISAADKVILEEIRLRKHQCHRAADQLIERRVLGSDNFFGRLLSNPGSRSPF